MMRYTPTPFMLPFQTFPFRITGELLLLLMLWGWISNSAAAHSDFSSHPGVLKLPFTEAAQRAYTLKSQ